MHFERATDDCSLNILDWSASGKQNISCWRSYWKSPTHVEQDWLRELIFLSDTILQEHTTCSEVPTCALFLLPPSKWQFEFVAILGNQKESLGSLLPGKWFYSNCRCHWFAWDIVPREQLETHSQQKLFRKEKIKFADEHFIPKPFPHNHTTPHAFNPYSPLSPLKPTICHYLHQTTGDSDETDISSEPPIPRAIATHPKKERRLWEWE